MIGCRTEACVIFLKLLNPKKVTNRALCMPMPMDTTIHLDEEELTCFDVLCRAFVINFQ